jgi:hypothetical protein
MSCEYAVDARWTSMAVCGQVAVSVRTERPRRRLLGSSGTASSPTTRDHLSTRAPTGAGTATSPLASGSTARPIAGTSAAQAAASWSRRSENLSASETTGRSARRHPRTVAWWLEHWLSTIAPRRVRQRTLESYESAVRRHLMPSIGRHRLDRLRPEHLDPALHRAARRRLLPRLRSPAPPHPVPGPHGCGPTRPRPAHRRRARRPARVETQRHRHRSRPRGGPGRPGSRRARPQLRPLDGRPHPWPAAVRGPGAAVEGRRPAEQTRSPSGGASTASGVAG